MCPYCGKNAPVVHRGLLAYCTACGRERPPFAGKSVTLAGKPSKVGGAVAGALGWLVLIGGTALAVTLGLLASALFPNSIAGLVLGLPLGITSLTLGLFLLFSGRKLSRSGEQAAHDAHVQAIFSLAAHRRRPLTAQEVSLAVDLPTEQADALLTQLAKQRSDDVTVEIGEHGEILYAFPRVAGRTRVRFSSDGSGPPHARVAPQHLRVDSGSFDASDRSTELDASAEDEAFRAPPRRESTR